MNPAYESLHKEMLNDIERTMQLHLQEMERVSSCFWIAANHWEELKKRVYPSLLLQEADEIDFFRNVKPKFTGYIQYFTIILEALLFVPDKREDEISYWQAEMKRYDFFCDKHSEFVKYYESGKDDLDVIYFTKAPKTWQPVSAMMTYDSDKKVCSTHDWIVRGLVAHKMYNEYAKRRREGMRIWF